MIVRGYVRRLDKAGSARLSADRDGGGEVTFDGPADGPAVPWLLAAFVDEREILCDIEHGVLVRVRP